MYEQKTYKCNKSTVVIREGDILSSRCEVICSSDNVGLQMGVGVARSIHDKTGAAIDADLDKVNLPVELGEVVVTTAGDLPQRYVFHCASDNRSSCRNEDIIPVIINRAVIKCLQLLPMLGVYSIAFPAIGTGAVGLDTEIVAKSMLEVIANHLQNTNHKLKIEIFAWGVDKFPIWKKAIESMKDFAAEKEVEEAEEQPVKEYDVFISYSWKDKDFAVELDTWLQEMGVNHFMDRNCLEGGQDHKEIIIDALEKVKLVLFVCSKHSNKSDAVKGEISNAIMLRKPIIPLRLDMTPYRKCFQYDLVNTLYVDATKGLEERKADILRYIRSYGIKTNTNR